MSFVRNQVLICAFAVNRKIANTVIDRDIRNALQKYAVRTLTTTITQRVVFAEAEVLH